MWWINVWRNPIRRYLFSFFHLNWHFHLQKNQPECKNKDARIPVFYPTRLFGDRAADSWSALHTTWNTTKIKLQKLPMLVDRFLNLSVTRMALIDHGKTNTCQHNEICITSINNHWNYIMTGRNRHCMLNWGKSHSFLLHKNMCSKIY